MPGHTIACALRRSVVSRQSCRPLQLGLAGKTQRALFLSRDTFTDAAIAERLVRMQFHTCVPHANLRKHLFPGTQLPFEFAAERFTLVVACARKLHATCTQRGRWHPRQMDPESVGSEVLFSELSPGGQGASLTKDELKFTFGVVDLIYVSHTMRCILNPRVSVLHDGWLRGPQCLQHAAASSTLLFLQPASAN